MQPPAESRPQLFYMLAAFAAGGLLTLMVHLNGSLAHYTSPLFSSLSAHGTGTVAAIAALLLLRVFRAPSVAVKSRAPWWAYLGGVSGAATVILTSAAVNSPLALAGTLALGLAGQVVFGLFADYRGLFGLPKRRPTLRNLAAFALVLAGSAMIILFAESGA